MSTALDRHVGVDQFQVQTTGYSAVYEGQGVMNYTIKQGGSKQHGSVYEFIRNTAFDTWGFLAHAPNPITGLPVKPVEHSNEYGINLSGPLVPFSSKWKQKVFYYGNYNGFRYTSATPTAITFPTPNEQAGNFTASGTYIAGTDVPIYDPSSQYACTHNSTNGSAGINTAMDQAPVQVQTAIRRCLELRIQSMSFLPASGPRLQRLCRHCGQRRASLRLFQTTTSPPTPRVSSIGPPRIALTSCPLRRTQSPLFLPMDVRPVQIPSAKPLRA